MIKSSIAQSDGVSRLFPDIVLTENGVLICVYMQCVNHHDRSGNGLYWKRSFDWGRTWTEEACLIRGEEPSHPPANFNCPRLNVLPDGTVILICDDYAGPQQHLWYSHDDGASWGEHRTLPLRGIVPDKYRVLKNGRHLICIHRRDPETGMLIQYGYYSDDEGKTWNETVIASDPRYHLCEACVVEMEEGTLVCFLRENSSIGHPIFRAISHDYGTTWEGVYPTYMYCGHRPTAAFYEKGKILTTYRFQQGPGGMSGNFFGAIFTQADALALDRGGKTRIFPLSFDRSESPDTGYSGWVRLPDGEFLAVNYIKDDRPKAYIIGIRFSISDICAFDPEEDGLRDFSLLSEPYFHGTVFLEKESDTVIPHRLPPETEAGYASVGNVHYPYASGVRIGVRTDARSLSLRFAVLKEMNREQFGIAWYIDGIRQEPVYYSTGQEEYTFSFPLDGKKHLVTVWLPHLSMIGLTHCLAEGASFAHPVKEKGRRYYAFGDSITQGSSVRCSDEAYPVAVAEHFGWELHQFGTSSGRYTPEALAGLDRLPKPDTVTVALGCNDWRSQKVPSEVFLSDCREYLRRIRELFPSAAVFVILPTWMPENGEKAGRAELPVFRGQIAGIAREFSLSVIDGGELVPGDFEHFPDGLHLNDAGFVCYRKNLINCLERELGTRSTDTGTVSAD